ncbi:hypothetical protein AVEN_135638-1 [Araneus ventricosus]|uniref:Uncharacterized protein n=1 Tax=Araneus ventricosus TaxID=182803 RepID=A0A4Y2J360_ARAVE|nr:hypothetical protein AVEN_135638-1 [Araneus ventricosus]
MLDSMRMADRAWMNVTQKKIKPFFKKAVFLVWKVNQMRSRNSTQKHTSVKNGRMFRKSSTFLKRQRLKNLRSSDSDFQVCGLMIFSQTISSPSSDEEGGYCSARFTASKAKVNTSYFMECSEKAMRKKRITDYSLV